MIHMILSRSKPVKGNSKRKPYLAALSLMLFLFCLWGRSGYSQNVFANPKANVITVKQVSGSDLLVPIDLDFVNAGTVLSNLSINITTDFKPVIPIISLIDPLDYTKLKIVNNGQALSVNAGETKKAANTFYLFIEKTLTISSEKTLNLVISNGGTPMCMVTVNIDPEDKLLSLEDYLKETPVTKYHIHTLDYVTKVESSNNVLTVGGFKTITAHDGTKTDVFLKKNIELKQGQVLAVKEWSWAAQAFHWRPFPISLTTIPFKVRPDITVNGKAFGTNASSGITNIGFNLDLVKYQIDRYFATGKKSTHKFSLGTWAGPSVEELDSVYTSGANGELGKRAGKMEKSKQLFISTGITLSYSYNDISFVFVPFGWDFGTSPIGKSWIYNKQRWWGFGLAISPKIFATVLNGK